MYIFFVCIHNLTNKVLSYHEMFCDKEWLSSFALSCEQGYYVVKQNHYTFYNHMWYTLIYVVILVDLKSRLIYVVKFL